ncbi:MAG: hypothetical protein ACI81V_000165 [Lentimonas sp.]|jgi:hypothetical protein
MQVLLLTVFLSLLLASLFLLFFMRERHSQQGHCNSPEQDALRPFDKEIPQAALRR